MRYVRSPALFLVLGGFDLLATLAAEEAHEAAYRVSLPASRLHDLGKGRALRAFHHRNEFGLLVRAVRFCLLGGTLGLRFSLPASESPGLP